MRFRARCLFRLAMFHPRQSLTPRAQCRPRRSTPSGQGWWLVRPSGPRSTNPSKLTTLPAPTFGPSWIEGSDKHAEAIARCWRCFRCRRATTSGSSRFSTSSTATFRSNDIGLVERRMKSTRWTHQDRNRGRLDLEGTDESRIRLWFLVPGALCLAAAWFLVAGAEHADNKNPSRPAPPSRTSTTTDQDRSTRNPPGTRCQEPGTIADLDLPEDDERVGR